MEFWWERDIPRLSVKAVGLTQPPVEWVALTTHPHLASRLKQGRAKPLHPLCAFMVCSRVKFTFSIIGAIKSLNKLTNNKYYYLITRT
jgi:hypothetical protein